MLDNLLLGANAELCGFALIQEYNIDLLYGNVYVPSEILLTHILLMLAAAATSLHTTLPRTDRWILYVVAQQTDKVAQVNPAGYAVSEARRVGVATSKGFAPFRHIAIIAVSLK